MWVSVRRALRNELDKGDLSREVIGPGRSRERERESKSATCSEIQVTWGTIVPSFMKIAPLLKNGFWVSKKWYLPISEVSREG